jgi:hypothetical protein
MLIVAIIMMIIIIPIMMSKNNREAFRHKSDIIIEEAMRVGRTAAGTLVGTRYLPGEPGHDNPLDRESRWLGTYVYEVHGKTYRCGVSSTNQLPQTLTVYYPAGHPEKGIAELTYIVGAKPIINTMFPVIVWGIIYLLLKILI